MCLANRRRGANYATNAEKTESLNSKGNPSIDLPRDPGDGPFLSAPSAGPNVQHAEIKEVFRRTDPFVDDILTNNRLRVPRRPVRGPRDE